MVFYELLAGRKAYTGDSIEQITSAVLNNHPAPAHELRSGVPPMLSAIAARAMARDPAQRFPSAAALSAALFTSATPRPASVCGSLWLGATLARFVVVPGVCLLVYWSAPSAGMTPVLAVVGTYLACLAAETATVVRIVHRSL